MNATAFLLVGIPSSRPPTPLPSESPKQACAPAAVQGNPLLRPATPPPPSSALPPSPTPPTPTPRQTLLSHHTGWSPPTPDLPSHLDLLLSLQVTRTFPHLLPGLLLPQEESPPILPSSSTHSDPQQLRKTPSMPPSLSFLGTPPGLPIPCHLCTRIRFPMEEPLRRQCPPEKSDLQDCNSLN